MGYVEDTLGGGETIEYDVSFHWLWTFGAYTMLVVLGWAVIGLIVFLKMMIRKWTTERVLTNIRFIQKTGWIVRHTEEIRIDRMEEVNLDQSLLGRILDYGDIKISGVGAGEIKLTMIDSPIEFQKKLNDLKAKFSASAR
jgi:uncharacterized membrane protein YdbT with pleckstrin-like domain